MWNTSFDTIKHLCVVPGGALGSSLGETYKKNETNKPLNNSLII